MHASTEERFILHVYTAHCTIYNIQYTICILYVYTIHYTSLQAYEYRRNTNHNAMKSKFIELLPRLYTYIHGGENYIITYGFSRYTLFKAKLCELFTIIIWYYNYISVVVTCVFFIFCCLFSFFLLTSC